MREPIKLPCHGLENIFNPCKQPLVLLQFFVLKHFYNFFVLMHEVIGGGFHSLRFHCVRVFRQFLFGIKVKEVEFCCKKIQC